MAYTKEKWPIAVNLLDVPPNYRTKVGLEIQESENMLKKGARGEAPEIFLWCQQTPVWPSRHLYFVFMNHFSLHFPPSSAFFGFAWILQSFSCTHPQSFPLNQTRNLQSFSAFSCAFLS